MPYSYPDYKNDIKNYFEKNIPKSTKILDVGPGAGTYADLLSVSGYNLDCLEIWEPYITQFNLKQKYKCVILGDIRDYDISKYDYIILGDILEHLSVEDATAVLDQISKHKQKCLVAVPYMYMQGECEGNIYETHHQPDLTHEIVLLRYPVLNLLFKNSRYGYYINHNCFL